MSELTFRRWTLLSAIVFIANMAVGQTTSPELMKLYDAHSCFQMREKISAPGTPVFYRAVAACNFREGKLCREGLRQVQRQAPSSDDAWEATSLLAQGALAEGRYSEALVQVKMLLRLRPADKDSQNAEAFFGALEPVMNFL